MNLMIRRSAEWVNDWLSADRVSAVPDQQSPSSISEGVSCPF